MEKVTIDACWERGIQNDLSNQRCLCLGFVKGESTGVVSGSEGRTYVLIESGQGSESVVSCALGASTDLSGGGVKLC